MESEWLHHGERCLETVRQFAAQKNAALYNLAEDGLFEREIPLPAALYAECLWNPAWSWPDILRDTARQPGVSL